ncbi:hypothetical protein [Tatumella ptyseos]|uniref:hypothetical protein n=1 Tax=Tatumella ptyseos TaxID=82987 RepID=UPI0026F13E41|nr:hypothetical protein [Tatumella ptyseos]WKX26997.1 hypothetical protein QJR74_02280 [Tatumella ptyseos]
MTKIISLVPNVEIIISVPAGKIIENKSVIYLLAQYIGVTVSVDKITSAQKFSLAEEMDNLVIIINHNDFIFLSDQEFEGRSVDE